MVKNHKYGEKKAQAIKVLSAAIIVSINKTKNLLLKIQQDTTRIEIIHSNNAPCSGIYFNPH